MRSNTIEVRPIAGALGAELHGVDLAHMSDEDFADVHEAFLAHQVVFFRDQTLTPVEQIGVAKRFGEIHLHPYMQGLPEHPEILEIIKREEDTKNFGGGWHTDQAFSPRPALCTLLYAKQTPSFGGDTMFTNMYAAYEALSDTMKQVLAPLKGLFLGDRSAAAGGPSRKEKYLSSQGAMRPKDPNADEGTQAEHPIVRTHPETGRKSLFLSSHTAKIVGMTDEESAPILSFLKQHAVRPEFTCRFRWEMGSFAIWDDRCTQHFAINDYNGQRRVMHRITVRGDVPV
jgi:taurine dioxygenase